MTKRKIAQEVGSSLPASPKRLTGAELRELLVAPCERLGVEVPSESECEENVRFLGSGPIEPRVIRTGNAHEHLVALTNALPEQIAWYKRTISENAAMPRYREAARGALAQIEALLGQLKACEGLVRELRVGGAESGWEPCAASAALLFEALMYHRRPSQNVGISAAGPLCMFVCSVLDRLGWRTGAAGHRQPTEAAVAKRLQRRRDRLPTLDK